MRLVVYAGTSIALAAGVIIYAFNQRANFYSACVYLAQSNLCLMILTNLILFLIASFMFGLQRMFYGPLRPIEIEQLYEKAWFAVTETCLAMTIFREEVGAWFLVMFVALLAGKVWEWIGEGRVEVLEQQPPANPRLFHLRLSFSLALSLVYDLWVMAYIVKTVIQQARPNMMVMFLFEFAVLTTSSTSTILRYGISLIEARVIKRQTQERLESRRREVREEREEVSRQRAAAGSSAEASNTNEPTPTPALPSEDDIDEIDIEVPGWEAKGQWVLTLDLVTDFCKLGIYTTFFFILLTFYGLPIHIMRDLFLTARSFVKRLSAFLRYRRATHDMNVRYPDATVEEIQREDTCIICREEMRPWSVTNPVEPAAAAANGVAQHPVATPRQANISERSRPKKLPCGHVLHLGCLKSWLERQQVCPTCRRPVVENARIQATQARRPGQGVQAQAAAGGAQPPALGPQANGGMRMLNLGPIRLGFGHANVQDLVQQFGGAQAGGQQNAAAPGAGPRVFGLEFGFPRLQPQAHGIAVAPTGTALPIQAQLQEVEERIMREIMTLRINQQELQTVQLLQAELLRLRSLQANATAHPTGSAPQAPLPPSAPFIPYSLHPTAQPSLQTHSSASGASPIPSGSPELPSGLTLPEGWTLLPLERLDEQPMNTQVRHEVPIPNANVSSTASGSLPATTITITRPASASGVYRSQSAPHVPLAPRTVAAFSPSAAAPTAFPPSTTAPTPRPEAPPSNLSGSTNTGSPVVDEQFTSPAPPNWAASQFFGSSVSNNDGVSSNIPITHLRCEEPEKPSPFFQNANGSTTQDHNETQAENGESSKGKGKAKAATVEDSFEEADT